MASFFRVLVPTLAILFVLGAPAASPADAAPVFRSEIESTRLTGEQTLQHIFFTDLGPIECEGVIFAGEAAPKTTTSTTLAPTYQECSYLGVEAEFDTNGCAFIFRLSAGETSGPYGGTMDIECPKGQAMQAGIPGICFVEIGPQAGLEEVGFENMFNAGGKSRDITIDVSINGISYVEAGLFCGNGLTTTGSYDGVTTIEGEDSGQNPVGILIE